MQQQCASLCHTPARVDSSKKNSTECLLTFCAASTCQKSLAEFRVRRREINIIRFLPRHVRGRKHFTRSERRIVRYQRTTEAQNAAKLSRKSGEATFSTVSNSTECLLTFRAAFGK